MDAGKPPPKLDRRLWGAVEPEAEGDHTPGSVNPRFEPPSSPSTSPSPSPSPSPSTSHTLTLTLTLTLLKDAHSNLNPNQVQLVFTALEKTPSRSG